MPAFTPASPQTEAKWAGLAATQAVEDSYFMSKMMGRGRENLIQDRVELEADSGDTIKFELAMALRNKPIIGDEIAQGKGEALRFYQDQVSIEQMRNPVSLGGAMSRKRSQIDIRRVAKEMLAEHMARLVDEIIFIYMSGAVGTNGGNTMDEAFGQNPIQAPDDEHLMFPNAVTAKTGITSADTMSVRLIEKAETKARMMRQRDPESSNLYGIKYAGGKQRYCVLMSPYQENDLRGSTNTGNWMDIQKAAAGAEGRNSPLFEDALGMVKGVILHSHERVTLFNDYGAGADLPAARALFLGRQAGVICFGSTNKQRFTWVEEVTDGKQKIEIICGAIWGFKKTRFRNRDFGSLAIDTYATPVN